MNPPDLSRDQSLGPYRILRTLGEGGMGTVYLAHDDSLDRPLAIKVLRTGLEDDFAAALTPRLLREARSAARLNHPHVVTIHTVGKHANQFYIAMEFCPGGSLADELRRNGPLDGDAAADAIRQACLALEAAHAAGIVHRDIKPANLLRSANSSIKLCDFGLARILNTLAAPSDTDLTHPGTFVGSPSYASPEQISASPTIDGRADLYALAATWYALLCGQPPFIAEDSADVMRKQLNDPFPDARKTRPDIRPDWMPILWKASAKKPADRYPTAAAMREAIEAVLRKPIPKPATPSARAKPLPLQNSAEASILALRSQLDLARSRSDSHTQIAALRSLFGLYSQTDRREEALRAFREAIALHVRSEASARFPHSRN